MHFNSRPWPLSVVSLIWVSTVFAADVTNPRQAFNLPVEMAEKSLKRFSVQSGRSVMFATDAVQDVRTNAVEGRFTPLEAIN